MDNLDWCEWKLWFEYYKDSKGIDSNINHSKKFLELNLHFLSFAMFLIDIREVDS